MQCGLCCSPATSSKLTCWNPNLSARSRGASRERLAEREEGWVSKVGDAAWESWEEIQRKAQASNTQDTIHSAGSAAVAVWKRKAGDAAVGAGATRVSGVTVKGVRTSDVLGRWRVRDERDANALCVPVPRCDTSKTSESVRSSREGGEPTSDACEVC